VRHVGAAEVRRRGDLRYDPKMNALALLLLLAAPAPPSAPPPSNAIGWVLGARPERGAWATYDAVTEAVTFTGAADGSGGDVREGKLLQRTRVTFLFLGAASVDGARGEWLELHEELLELKGDGVPEGMPAGGHAMVTRVLLAPDGKVLRTVTQRRGRPAEERPVTEGMSVAIGALAPFEGLQENPTAGRETIKVASLGKVAAVTHQASGSKPRRSTKIWRRASDGLCLELVDATEGTGTTKLALTASGRGGATKVEGPIRQADDPR
jgi:hypothetical protein